MTKTIKRYISFLLVLMLMVTMLPTAFAAEVSGVSTTATEETVSETTSEAAASPAPEGNVDISQPPPDETEATDATDSAENTTAQKEETLPEALSRPSRLELL